jgi:hypothetical protein
LNPKQFLLFGGVVLLLVGVLGFLGILGPTADDSIFGEMWWFDNAENWAHTVLGVVAILAAFIAPASMQRPLVMLVGGLALLVGIYNFFSTKLIGANLESPADLILHLVVGAWALYASMNKTSGSMTPMSTPPPSMPGPM